MAHLKKLIEPAALRRYTLVVNSCGRMCLAAAALLAAANVFAVTSTDLKRPFRTRVIKFDENLDRIKPLAMGNHPGWSSIGNVLYGPLTSKWVGGFQLDTGRWLWWYDSHVEVSSPIAVFGTSLFFSALDGRLIRLDSSTGKEQWRVNLDSFVTRELSVSNTRVIALTSRQQLYAVDAQSGTTQWLYDAGSPDGIAIQSASAPLVQGDTVYIGLANGEIHAIQADSGKLLWKTSPAYVESRFHDVVGELATFGSNLLFTRYDGLVGSISLTDSDRKMVWKDDLTAITTSAFRNGRYYVGLLSGDVHAIDAASGRKLWRRQLGQSIGSISATDESLFVAGARGRVAKLSLEDGELLWHDSLDGTMAAKPVFLDNEILFSTGLKVLYGYKMR